MGRGTLSPGSVGRKGCVRVERSGSCCGPGGVAWAKSGVQQQRKSVTLPWGEGSQPRCVAEGVIIDSVITV